MKQKLQTLIIAIMVIISSISAYSQSDKLVIYKSGGTTVNMALDDIRGFSFISDDGIPNNLRAIVIEKQKIVLAWNSVQGADYYRLYRSTSQNGVYSQINRSSTPAYEDAGNHLTPATTYYYKVRSEDNNVLSELSDYFSVTTLDSNSETPVYPMIRPQRLTVSKKNWTNNEQIDLRISTYNAGNSAAQSYTMDLYLTKNPAAIDNSAIRIATGLEVNNHPVSTEKNVDVEITVPNNITGNYHIAVQVDPEMEVYQEDRSKSTKISTDLISIISNFTKADLSGRFENIPKEYLHNKVIDIPVSVINGGALNAVDFKVQLYLSKDKNITTNDFALGSTVSWGTVNYQTTLTKNVEVTISDELFPGEYFLGAIIDTDDDIEEISENNNIILSDVIYIYQNVQTVKISGKITNLNNLSNFEIYLAGVKFIDTDGFEGQLETNSNGEYEIIVPKGKSLRLEPYKAGYTFLTDDSEPFGYVDIINIQSDMTGVDFQAFDLKKAVDDIARISKAIPEGMIDNIINDKDLAVIKKGAKLYSLANEIKGIYDLFVNDKDELEYYFDIAEFLLGKAGPFGEVAAQYISITSEIFDIIKTNITIPQRRENLENPLNYDDLIVTLKIMEDDGRSSSSYDIEDFIDFVNLELYLYEKTSNSNLELLDIITKFEKGIWSDLDNRMKFYNGKMNATLQKLIEDYSNKDLVWIMKFDFKNPSKKLVQRLYIPITTDLPGFGEQTYELKFHTDGWTHFGYDDYIIKYSN